VGTGVLDRAPRFALVVDAPERPEMARVEALDPDRQAIDAGGAEIPELPRVNRSPDWLRA